MKVSIIGGGLGGLACAISLAHKGYDVHLFEKNSTLGGKMRPITLGDYYFDFGPNTITMPYVFNQVIEQTGVDAAPYFRFVEVQPHMKNVGVNGETFYLSNNRAFMIRQLQHLDPHGAKNYPAFITEISRLYFLARQHFLNKAFLSKKDFISPKLANALLAVRPFETLEEAFGTGTAAVISPVGELKWRDEKILINNGEIGEISQMLYDTLTGIQNGTLEDSFGWTIKL